MRRSFRNSRHALIVFCDSVVRRRGFCSRAGCGVHTLPGQNSEHSRRVAFTVAHSQAKAERDADGEAFAEGYRQAARNRRAGADRHLDARRPAPGNRNVEFGALLQPNPASDSQQLTGRAAHDHTGHRPQNRGDADAAADYLSDCPPAFDFHRAPSTFSDGDHGAKVKSYSGDYADPETFADAFADPEPETDPNAYPVADAEPETIADAQSVAHSETNPHAVAQAISDSQAVTHAEADTYSDACAG